MRTNGIDVELGSLSRVLEVCMLDILDREESLHSSDIKLKLSPHGAWYDTVSKDLCDCGYISKAIFMPESYLSPSLCGITSEGGEIIKEIREGNLKATDTKLGTIAANREKKILDALLDKSPLWSSQLSTIIQDDLVAFALSSLVHHRLISMSDDMISNGCYEITNEGKALLEQLKESK